MNEASAADLLSRARQVMNSAQPEMTEHEGSASVDRYLDVNRFSNERELLLRFPYPVLAAQIVSAAGSWWSGEFMGRGILVTRDQHRTLRAFANVCRHRGARVVDPGEGCGKTRFSCPYHAWTYGADGALLSVPQEQGFPDLRKADAGLQALACTQRAGLIWVIPALSCADRDIDAMLGHFLNDLEALGMDAHFPYASRELDLACNWKLIVEGSSEAYHFKIAHRQTIAPMFAQNTQIVDEDGLNRRMFIVKESLRSHQGNRIGLQALRQHGNFLYFFFPATLILVQPDHVQVTRLEVNDPGRTQVFEIALVPDKPETEKARSHWDRNVELYRRTLGEDFAQMESIQKGLETGANSVLRFGRFESALTRFNEQLDALLATRLTQ